MVKLLLAARADAEFRRFSFFWQGLWAVKFGCRDFRASEFEYLGV